MTENDFLIMQSNIARLLRYTIRLHCRHEVTNGLLVGVLARDDASNAAKILLDMQLRADKLAEDILLQVGDSNPQGADLLGVQEFLRKHESGG